MNKQVTVVKEFTFDAAHFLPGYEGPCSDIHGHTYKLQIGVKGEVGHQGMVMDFNEIKKFVDEYIISKLDHKLLNSVISVYKYDFPYFQPTAERMVLFFVTVFSELLLERGKGVALDFVRLWETPTSYAEWRDKQ